MNETYDFDGILWRVIPSGAISAYDLRYTNRQASGRWHDDSGPGCFYASLTEEGAIAEFQKRRENEYLPVERHHMVQVKMKVLNVIDLTSVDERSKNFITKNNMTEDTDDDLKACQKMSLIAQSRGFQAIKSFCAPEPSHHNLNIFVNTHAPEWIAIDDVPHREPVSNHL